MSKLRTVTIDGVTYKVSSEGDVYWTAECPTCKCQTIQNLVEFGSEEHRKVISEINRMDEDKFKSGLKFLKDQFGGTYYE